MCVLIFYTTLSKVFLILGRNERDMIKKSIMAFMERSRYSCQILMKLQYFSIDFRKTLKYKVSQKFVQWGAEMLYTEGQTDTTKPIVAFRNFSKASKN